MRYCFINCFGEIYLWIAQVSKDIAPRSTIGTYSYDLGDAVYWYGKDFDLKPKLNPFLGKIRVKVSGPGFSGIGVVAHVDLYNTIDWDFGGCLGQSYPLVLEESGKTTEGYTNAQLKADDLFRKLVISNIEVIEASCRDYEIEAEIQKRLDEKEKEASYAEYIRKGNELYASKDYKASREQFRNAASLKSEESFPRQKINELDQLIKQQEVEENFKKFVSEGDAAVKNGKKYDARTAYKEALNMKPGDKAVLAKLNSLGEDKVDELLGEMCRIANRIGYKAFDDGGYIQRTYSYSGTKLKISYKQKSLTIHKDYMITEGNTVYDLKDLTKIQLVNGSNYYISASFKFGERKGKIYPDEDESIFYEPENIKEAEEILRLLKQAALAAGTQLE